MGTGRERSEVEYVHLQLRRYGPVLSLAQFYVSCLRATAGAHSTQSRLLACQIGLDRTSATSGPCDWGDDFLLRRSDDDAEGM